jgi:hypothetical protein
MIHFSFIPNKGTDKVYERYPAPIELPELIHKVCRTIQRKHLATFSILMDGLPNPYFNVDQDFLSISTEITEFLSFLKNPSPKFFKLHFHERSMSFEFYAVGGLEISFKCVQKGHILLDSTVPCEILLESVETMFNNFSDLIESKFPRAYKKFKAENFIL